jgi:hypothetical protein
MIHARVQRVRLKLLGPIPKSWEGREVTIRPATEDELTPDDPIPDLEEKLAALHALGPMQWEPGERERIEQEIREMDRISREKLLRLPERFE